MAERSAAESLTDLQRHILVAVVEGYRAREGMKDRIRALNEWEIARRSGSTELSYAEYMRDPARESLMAALAALERLGLVSTWERGATYDTFVPTERGGMAVDTPNGEPTTTGRGDPGPSAAASASDPVLERLDEIIRLLRSIDTRLPR